MATIVHALWLAAEQALFSCNDWALWNFFSAQRSFDLWVKLVRVGENSKKDDKVQLYFQQLKEKLAYRYFFSMSDKESRILSKNSAKKAI